MLVSVYLLLLGLLVKTSTGKVNTNTRSKRFIVQTEATQFGAFATVSVPIHPDSSVSMAWFFEANFYTTANSTLLRPLLGLAIDEPGRHARDVQPDGQLLTRKSMYHFMESMFERQGFEGRGCLLRAICENSRTHFLHNGVLGDILHLLLTPSASASEQDVEDDFYVAEYLGHENECLHYEDMCRESPFNYISMFT